MSLRVNNYESNLLSAFQRQMSKREAEEAILNVREGLYGDSYTFIHPKRHVDKDGSIIKKWPPIKSLVWAYFNNGYDEIRKLFDIDDPKEKKEEEKITPSIETPIKKSASLCDILFSERYGTFFSEPTQCLNPNPEKVASYEMDVGSIHTTPSGLLNKYKIHFFGQNNPHHIGSLQAHTEEVFSCVNLLMPKDAPHRTDILLAATFHDAGKPQIVSVNPKTGYDQFLGHANASVEFFDGIKNNLSQKCKFDKEYVSELIRLHDIKYSKQGKCQEMLNSHPNGFAKDLITLQYADVMGQAVVGKAEKLEEVYKYAQFICDVGAPEQIKGIKDFMDLIKESIERATERELDYKEKHKDVQWLGRTFGGQDIFVGEYFEKHMAAHPDVDIALVREAIGKINRDIGEYKVENIDMKRIVGKDHIIEVGDGEAKLAYRKGREYPEKVVLESDGYAPRDTSLINVGICKNDNGDYEIFTAFYGEKGEPAVASFDDHDLISYSKAVDYWNNHAIIVTENELDLDKEVPEEVSENEVDEDIDL